MEVVKADLKDEKFCYVKFFLTYFPYEHVECGACKKEVESVIYIRTFAFTGGLCEKCAKELKNKLSEII